MSILIANNGLAAVKFIRSVKLIYPEIEFVGIVSKDDLDANAYFIELLDVMEQVPGGPGSNNYANVGLIVQTAQKYNCKYVWPGWGHASENPMLPDALATCGIIFIGPLGKSMRALGDKINSTILAQTIGVPTIPWNGSHLKGELTNQMIYEASVHNVMSCINSTERVGLPVMIKASEGGGGKGIRFVSDMTQCQNAFANVQSEVPGSPVFITKSINRARHIEVQIAGDQYGNVIALSGRDCSVQRRHQKIIEEGPPNIVPFVVFEQMKRDAIALGKAVDYINLGTVEFLFCPETNEYYFLELNPRLQVEHTVTELITGLNLPVLQLDIAMGSNLSLLTFNDHGRFVVACRITAENDLFLPTTGTIEEIHFDSYSDTFGYFSVYKGSIHSYSDSQFGHVFVTSDSRKNSIQKMQSVLETLRIKGSISSSVNSLKRILNHDEYIKNEYTTQWLDKLIADKYEATITDDVIAKVTAIRGYNLYMSELAKFKECLTRGGEPYDLPKVNMDIQFVVNGLKVKLPVLIKEGNVIRVGDTIEYRIVGGYISDPVSHTSRYSVCDGNMYIDNICYNVRDLSDDRLIVADIVGVVNKVKFKEGQDVRVGDVLMDIEAMKMIMEIRSKTSGTFKRGIMEGAVFSKGELLCTVEGLTELSSLVQTVHIAPMFFEVLSFDRYRQFDCTFHTKYQSFFKAFPHEIYDWVCWMNNNPKNTETRRNITLETVFHELLLTFTSVQTKERETEGMAIRIFDCVLDGREVIVVGNGSAFAGSMSFRESEVYYEALKDARDRKCAFVYLAGTSGARVGMNKSILDSIQVKYSMSGDIEYLYVVEKDFDRDKMNGVQLDDGCYRIETIIGEPGFGVDNLSGSALVAGEMARAYREITTITYVFNHTTGIGAYLARLSGRLIQHKDTSLLLTGAKSLNALLGRNVYKSNAQLGGANEIMGINGVTQIVVDDDKQGVEQIHHLLTSKFPNGDNHILLDTSQEYMADYAKSVHTYRGTIGTKVYGLIEPCLTPIDEILRVDHEDLNSREIAIRKANHVLYPETSYKISQFINECNVESLPLVIIANWRGFSGGTKDMFGSVLKYGSMIVDSIAHYDHPITVYIPPGGQLRGGSWVVFDKKLNTKCIKMYCAPDASGSILEPNGLCAVKAKSFEGVHKNVQKVYATLHNDPRSFKYLLDGIIGFEELKNMLS